MTPKRSQNDLENDIEFSSKNDLKIELFFELLDYPPT